MFRVIPVAAALLLLFILASCGGNSERGLSGTGTTDITAAPVFSLSDAEIEAFEASEEVSVDTVDWSLGEQRLLSEPPVMPGSMVVDVEAGDAGLEAATKGASTFNWSKKCNQCGKRTCKTKNTCKDKCNQCGKNSCKTKHSCKNKCSQCDKRDCKQKDRCKPEKHKCKVLGICNFTERFWVSCDCEGSPVCVCYAAKVVFEDDNCGKCKKSGVEVIFCREGQEIGRAVTDNSGWAFFQECDVPVGSYISTVKTDTFSADLRTVVYNNCLHACVNGKGRLPSINNDRYAIFSYEFHFDQGNLVYGGWFNFLDGDIVFNNASVTWFVLVNGNEVHFGNGEYYVRALDLGKAPGADYTEIYVWGRDYYNEGNLLNGQIRTSWAPGPAPASKLP